MSLENFEFSFTENDEGFTVTLKGNKEKLRGKLEAFEAFLNFREKAKQAGFEHAGGESPIHQFFKVMHKHHAHHGGGHGHCQHGHHGYHGNPPKSETTVSQSEEKKTAE
ncbi:hypothetical protein [Desulfosporosinus meridiei]|uniref:Uncharacterized protein n=1 Tax=Desulfosporosinus meridiei (strain ATCC BAA-275 / DSM 13257 / KCTC 12902 / NCIMB 13706 / S10) TaxID=768704 RepID=J7INQ1_DESMD|nr:hypothetical protein [Desulfosporosinus meridiei]AFQ43457.1 hypothetical protein Desmer_1464 [Desulfosporosinus meridiei DSM 13257]